jgi:hypothetical protein
MGFMDVLQCPDCALKFRFESELEQHLRDEHPEFHADPKNVEDSLHKARRNARRGGPRQDRPEAGS